MALTNPGDTILDPYAGVGSSLIAGILWDRKVIGVDNQRQFTDLSYNRIIKAINGSIKKRPLLKPVQTESGLNESVPAKDGTRAVYTASNQIYKYRPLERYAGE